MRIGPFRIFERKALPQTDEDILALLGGAAGTITKAQAMEVAAVKSAITVQSEAAATLDIKVVRITEDGTETDDPAHPVAKLLQDHVNPWTSKFEFVRDLMVQALTNDSGGIAWVNRVDGKPVEILRYQPGVVSVAYSDVGERTYTLDGRTLDAADVIHLRDGFNRCALTMAMRAITVAWHLENHAINLFRKGARPGGVIEFPGNLGAEALVKMKAGWRQSFDGSENTGNTAVLWDGAKFAQMTLNSTDAQFLENRRFAIIEIARAFRVPPGMLFELERQTYTNGEQQGREFLSYGLEPWLQALEACLRRALFNDEERPNYKIVIDRDDLTRADLAVRANAINSLIASETINPNTGRQWLGLQSYEGGEKYGNRNINVQKVADTGANTNGL